MVIMTAEKMLINAGLVSIRPQFPVISLTSHRKKGHIFESPRDGEDETNDHAHNLESNSAGAMFRQSVEHDRKCKNMAAHHKDQEEKLGVSDQFPAEAAHEDMPSVSHVMHMRVP